MMKPSSNYWAIVPAAGVGRRFSADIPKQFHQLHGELVAQHTLSRLLSITKIKRIVAPCDPSSGYWSRVKATSNSRVQLILGGKTRARSVLNGLVAIQQDANPDDWVLVHDMVRPCVTCMDINKLIDNVEEHPVGGFLAAPINETLKLVTSDNKVTKTVDRNQYRIAQTPQMFRAGMLQEAIQSMIKNQLEPTDEASAIEYIGKQAMVINGRQDNIKITRREDLMIAEAILQDQEKQGCV